jgi:hypothetical protein
MVFAPCRLLQQACPVIAQTQAGLEDEPKMNAKFAAG